MSKNDDKKLDLIEINNNTDNINNNCSSLNKSSKSKKLNTLDSISTPKTSYSQSLFGEQNFYYINYNLEKSASLINKYKFKLVEFSRIHE